MDCRIVYDNQALRYAVSFLDLSGDLIDITGRTFSMVIATQKTAVKIGDGVGAVAAGTSVALTIANDAIIAARTEADGRALELWMWEVLDADADVFLRQPLRIDDAPPGAAVVGAPDSLGPVTLIERVPGGGPVIIRSTGSPGPAQDISGKADLIGAEFTGLVTAPTLHVGSGDVAKPPLKADTYMTGTVVDVRRGTAAVPVHDTNPAAKFSKYSLVTQADRDAATPPLTGAGDDEYSALSGTIIGAEGGQVQVTGVFGSAFQNSIADFGNGSAPDACGVFGKGVKAGPGLGTGMGGFFVGQRYYAEGIAQAVQLSVLNWSGVATTYDPLINFHCGIWLVPGGNADTGAAILVANPFGRQFDVGYAIPGATISGKLGAVKTASFVDDGGAIISLRIRGKHTTAFDTTSAELGGVPNLGNAVLMAPTHRVSWGDVGLKRTAAGRLAVTDGGAGAGTLDNHLPGRSFSSGVAATVTNTLAKTVLATIVIPAGVMGANGKIEVIPLFSGTSNGNNKTFGIDFGGTVMWSTIQTANSAVQPHAIIGNANSAAVQYGFSNAAGVGISTPAGVTAAAIDTTAAVNLTIWGQLANIADTITLVGYLVRVTPAA